MGSAVQSALPFHPTCTSGGIEESESAQRKQRGQRTRELLKERENEPGHGVRVLDEIKVQLPLLNLGHENRIGRLCEEIIDIPRCTRLYVALA